MKIEKSKTLGKTTQQTEIVLLHGPSYTLPWGRLGYRPGFLSKDILAETIQGLSAEKMELPAGLKPGNIRGGIKVAHVHVGDNLYMLNDEQWKKLSAQIVQRSQEKLAKVQKPVSFEQAAALANAVEQLP